MTGLLASAEMAAYYIEANSLKRPNHDRIGLDTVESSSALPSYRNRIGQLSFLLVALIIQGQPVTHPYPYADIVANNFIEFSFMPTPIEQDEPQQPPLEVETVSEAAEDDASTVLVAAEIISDASKTKPPPRKRPKKKPQIPASDSIYNMVPPQRVEAASDARAILEETVQSLPVTLPGPVTEAQVRSFGRLCIDGPCDGFNSPSALYPIGFCCDRFDFSPVHGRIIKLRCSILSGKSIKESQRKGGFPVSDIPDGPIFRILWGQGIDDEEDSDYPFNPSSCAPPVVSTGFPATDNAINEVMTTTTTAQILPEVGMKVKVRFENDQYFFAVITSVGESSAACAKTKRKRKQVDLTVQYDDGSTEALLFPDPDLFLEPPGAGEDIGRNGEIDLKDVNGKPVFSVVGTSPLRAWGNVLIKLGLIDEIMLDDAMESVEHSRREGLKEAKDRMLPRSNKKKDGILFDSTTPAINVDEPGEEKKDGDCEPDITMDDPDREPTSAEEEFLLKEIEDVERELANALNKEEQIVCDLSVARQRALGPWFCNPFTIDESSKSQQSSWLAIAVRKEKSRMGSTGNKRKIVTAVDLLERNDSIVNPDIEALIEGLPGSEFCMSYVFQAFRASGAAGASRSWVHEAQLRNEKETMKPLQLPSRDNKSDIDSPKEKQVKRKAQTSPHEDGASNKKKLKLEEEFEKKKVRVDERLARLDLQVNDRLRKEAATQREKLVMTMVKSLNKEYTRRRKAAEIVSAQTVLEGLHMHSQSCEVIHLGDLPKPGAVYNEAVVRTWNFLSTFKAFFLERGYMAEMPSLQALQNAIDSLYGSTAKGKMEHGEAVSFLTDLVVGLCKPLAARVTRVLMTSLVALNPALQKEFGASFFNDVNAASDGAKKDKVNSDALLLPINHLTWKEAVRLLFLSDGLAEIGHARHECSHLLRGYRSAGHPNSKEFRRLRKAEDFSQALTWQQMNDGEPDDIDGLLGQTSLRIDMPCAPLAAEALNSQNKPPQVTSALPSSAHFRVGTGLLDSLSMTKIELKELTLQRERYMEDALVLKEEMERQKLKEQGEDIEDDDDDEDDDEDLDSKSTNSDVVEKPKGDTTTQDEPKPVQECGRIGKETPYDDFCADIPSAPEVIRRCLAVLRALAVSGPAEPFLYPVDPQTNPGYYDAVLRPMCLREAGKQLKDAVKLYSRMSENTEELLEDVVVKFGRNIRLIGHNSLTYANAGPTVIAAGTELLRLFERLLLDWVLAPEYALPPLVNLDDEKCVDQHPMDDGSTVLLCDGCEGKYNIARLDPPLREIPKGDWYCPRCVSGFWYGDIDPRIGKSIRRDGCALGSNGIITRCLSCFPDRHEAEPTLRYVVEYEDETEEIWLLSDVDKALALMGSPVPPVRYLRAVLESPGYGFGVNHGLKLDVVPSLLNPRVCDAAARMVLASTEFRDMIETTGRLVVADHQSMNAKEWLRLLILLVIKNSASDLMQNYQTKMENDAAARMTAAMESLKKQMNGTTIMDILPPVDLGDEDESPLSDLFVAHPAATETQEVQSPMSSDRIISSSTTVVDAGVVEVISESNIGSENGIASPKPALAQSSKKDNMFQEAFKNKAKRQKMIEESFASLAIRKQMKSVVASFESDELGSAIETMLSPSDSAFAISELQHQDMKCAFCGFGDADLGSAFVRVPDDKEWEELMSHATRSRRTHLVAEFGIGAERSSMLCSVTVRVNGNLFSSNDCDLCHIKESGMTDFCLFGASGFQSDLRFRYEMGLPFVTGSLVAHDCCASAVHFARKEKIVQKKRANIETYLEREEGLSCGRTLAIGSDISGRSYWKFNEYPNTLFVCDDGSWLHYDKPEQIASVIVAHGKDPIAKDLRQTFPDVVSLLDGRKWADIIMKNWYFSSVAGSNDEERMNLSSSQSEKEQCVTVQGGFDPFHVDENVLVESKSGIALWDAKIVEVSKREESNGGGSVIDAYRVHYEDWGDSFLEWVKPRRVLADNEINRALQTELLEERSFSKCGLPPVLKFLHAKSYLYARDRVRGSLPLPDFARISHISKDNPSQEEKDLALCKATLLAIEAALPLGSVDTRENGRWRNDHATQWRMLVVESTGHNNIMQCLVQLESAIADDWFKESHNQIRLAFADGLESDCRSHIFLDCHAGYGY